MKELSAHGLKSLPGNHKTLSQVDNQFIDHYLPRGWNFVRTKVIKFNPGRAKSCSLSVLPKPKEDSLLIPLTTEAVAINDFAQYVCNDTVKNFTNDGFVFKLKCMPWGKFQGRKLFDEGPCR